MVCRSKTTKKKDLTLPINKLEKRKDSKKVWRNKVNFELQNDYKKIFNLIDKLIFLKVPSFKYVFKYKIKISRNCVQNCLLFSLLKFIICLIKL